MLQLLIARVWVRYLQSRFEAKIELQLCAVGPLCKFPKNRYGGGFPGHSLLKDHKPNCCRLHTKIRAFTQLFCNSAVPSPSIVFSEITREDYVDYVVYDIHAASTTSTLPRGSPVNALRNLVMHGNWKWTNVGLLKIKPADSALTRNGASVTRPSSDLSGRTRLKCEVRHRWKKDHVHKTTHNFLKMGSRQGDMYIPSNSQTWLLNKGTKV